jgi:DinB superfamily
MLNPMRLVILVLLTVSIATQAQQPPAAPQSAPQPPKTIGAVLERQLRGIERELVPAAEAMPAEKYGFAPTNGEFKGVRNFGEQVKHAAATNYVMFAAMLGEKPPAGTADDNGPAALKTKDELVRYLRDSFALGVRAVANMDEKTALELVQSPFGPNKTTRLGLATGALGHSLNHYGQIVEYLRMNSIIPPASR